MIPAPDHQDRLPVSGGSAQKAVARNRDRLVQAGDPVGDRGGNRMQHGAVGEHLFPPAAAEIRREPQGAPTTDHPVVQVGAGGGPTPGTVGAGGIDTPGQTRYARVDGHPGARHERASRAGLDDPAGDLVTQDERERAHRAEGWRRPGVVGEQVEVAPTDPPDGHRTRAHSSLGRSGSGRSTSEAGNTGSAMSNWMARTGPA